MASPEASRFESRASDYYARKLGEHGPTAKGMDWRDEATQRLRFEVLLRHVGPVRGASVLDVGCGSGELLRFLRDRGEEPARYLGVDVVPGMVEATQARFGRGAARLAPLSALDPAVERFDLVLASGTFNVKQDESEDAWRGYFHDSVERMYRLCARAVAWNAMTTCVSWRHDHLYYASCDEIAALAVARLSRRFVIDHSYPLFELTATVLREPEA